MAALVGLLLLSLGLFSLRMSPVLARAFQDEPAKKDEDVSKKDGDAPKKDEDAPAKKDGDASTKKDEDAPAKKDGDAPAKKDGDAPAKKPADEPNKKGGDTTKAVPADPVDENRPPIKVTVGIYVSQIVGVSLKDNNFTVDYYIWFRWKEDDFNPLENVEIINGKFEGTGPEPQKLKDGTNYVYRRGTTTVTEFWDVSRFPLDNHTLQIALEDGDKELDKMVFVADTENSGYSPDLTGFPGYDVVGHKAEVVKHTYSTNYGFTDYAKDKKSEYSRFILSIELKRVGWGYFMKMFAGLFTATAIALLVFFIKPTEVDPRFGLGAGAIFAAVASEYVVTSSLPDTSILTMADSLHIVAFAFIFLSIAESVYSLKLYSSEEVDQITASKKMDMWSAALMGIGYVVVSTLVVIYS